MYKRILVPLDGTDLSDFLVSSVQDPLSPAQRLRSGWLASAVTCSGCCAR